MTTIKQRPIPYLLIFFIVTISLSSCVEKIDLIVDDHDKKRLVVEGMITTDTTSHIVKLTKTAPYFSQKPAERVSGAEVAITDHLGNIYYLNETEPGVYKTDADVYGVIGHTYHLNINYEDELFSAQSTMKRVPVIDSLSYQWDPLREQYNILLYGKEPEGRGDIYMWHVYKNGKQVTDTLDKVLYTNDEFFDGNYIYGLEITHWYYNYNIQKNDTVRIDTHSITEDALLFLTGMLYESNYSGSPFDAPPANIHSNISNDAIGLFLASAITRKTIIIE